MRQDPRITVVAYSIPVLNRRIVMSYAIVGFGTVGQALARAFARKNIVRIRVTTLNPAK
jgi:voltage-gated potassium channel Kch